MTTEELIIAVVRVLGSLPVLRWPLGGGLLAVVVDLSDLFLMNLLTLGGVSDYQAFDKWLDQVYLACFLLVALRWPGPLREIAAGLYALRMAGFVAFELTGVREVLVVFPNLFEFWFLFVAATFRPGPAGPAVGLDADHGATSPGPVGRWPNGTRFRYSRRTIVTALAVLLLAKEGQEVVIHWLQLLDSFTAVEAVEAVWDWVTGPL